MKKNYTPPLSDEARAAVREMFLQNEVEANRFMILTAQIVAATLVLILSLVFLTGFFVVTDSEKQTIILVIVSLIVLILIVSFISYKLPPRCRVTRYLLMGSLILLMSVAFCYYQYYIVLFMIFPVVMSCRYYSRRYTIEVALFSGVCFTAAAVIHARFGIGTIDLNAVDVTETVTLFDHVDIYETLLQSGAINTDAYFRYYLRAIQLLRLTLFIALSAVCALISDRGSRMVTEQSEVLSREARVNSELSLAAQIQAGMLPNRFPAFPDRTDFDLYALMEPAKTVGGDFYDFFLMDPTHLAVLVADVSDKGIPSSLFMAKVLTLLQGFRSSETSPAKILTEANRLLCASDKESPFVTVWLGILETDTGRLVYTNAGHVPPLLISPDGTRQYLTELHGIALAVFDCGDYTESEIFLRPGDSLFSARME